MNMVKVKTAELAGQALDWAVAISVGWQPDRPQYGQLKREKPNEPGRFNYIIVGDDGSVDPYYLYAPSTNWSQCGELIKPHEVAFSPHPVGRIWRACALKAPINNVIEEGETPQIAICRAVVASKLGDEVDVPKELVGVGHD